LETLSLVGLLTFLERISTTSRGGGAIDLFIGSMALLLLLLILLAGLLLLFTLSLILWRFVELRRMVYGLTNLRVLMRWGVFTLGRHSIPLSHVQDVKVKQGIPGRMFNYGTVNVTSASTDGKRTLHDIPDPMGFSEAILFAARAEQEELHHTG
jgi:uncharacterized membrane protein YdbT with pleckstrin-like domain